VKFPEFKDPTLRELLAYSYRIIYKVETEEIIIAQRTDKKFDPPWTARVSAVCRSPTTSRENCLGAKGEEKNVSDPAFLADRVMPWADCLSEAH
jgi:hypothetical protein